jgi:ligand-binding sensor domain-containing protein/class 3 adenylate cyclase
MLKTVKIIYHPFRYLCILTIALFAILIGCSVENPKMDAAPEMNNEDSSEQFYLINVEGDTIPTGVSIPAKGKWINPDSVTQPKKIPLLRPPKVVQTPTNVHPVRKPKVVQIPKKLTIITPGQDGIPLPVTVPAQGKKVPILFSAPMSKLPPLKKDAANYNIQYLDMDQGMLSPYVSSMLEDSKGNLWFGARGGGVSRYDGHSFTHFTPKEGLSSPNVYSILEDSRGNLWFGTTNGLNCYNGQYFTRYTTEEGLSSNWIHSMLEDSKGNLWFGTYGGGVNRYDGHSFTHFTTKEGLLNNTLSHPMLEDSQGNLWFGTRRGVNRFDGKSFLHFTTKEGLSDNYVMSMLEDRQGYIWFGTYRGGVNRYDPYANNGQGNFTHFTTEQGLSHNGVNSMMEDKRGNLWFGTRGGGANCYDPNANEGQGSFTYFTTNEGLSHNWVFNMLEDSQGNLWFGTNGGGVNRYNPSLVSVHNNFTYFTTEEGLSYNDVRFILEDSQGDMWFATAREGVNRFSLSTSPELNNEQSKGQFSFTHFTTKEGLSSNLLGSMLEDSQGNLWFGTSNGLSRFNGQSFTHFTTKEGLSQDGVISMLEDSQGNLWFGTSRGLNRFDPKANDGQGSFIHFTTKEGLSHDEVISMLEDRQGNLWFGTSSGGVSCYDPNTNDGQGSFTHFTTNEGLHSNIVYSMLEDSQGNLWFGYNSVWVSRYDGRDFSHYKMKSSFESDLICAIVEDVEKNIWIGSEKSGVMVLVPPSGKAPDDDYKTIYLDKKYGLLNSDIRCIYPDSHGRIWIGSVGGVNMLDLNQFELPTKAPRNLQLRHIEIEQQYVDYRRLTDTAYHNSIAFGKILSTSFDSVAPFNNYPLGLTLPYELNHLTFHFNAIDWTALHKLEYSFWMEGLDENWSPLQSETRADYRNIPPGKHKFKVKAIGAAQVWGKPLEYTFSVLPPWWLTWWAKTIYLLIGGLLIFGIIRWRMASLQKQKEELKQTVKERTSELEVQKERSDELLLNILPSSIVEELKQTGHIEPMFFEEVSILFADFKGFTNIASTIPGKKLVKELDDIFHNFDDVIESVGLEKIQTIGDAYVAAGGLPKPDPDHAVKSVMAGQKFIEYLDKRNQTSSIKWKIRVGIHTGPVTAGVVGKRKFSYDIFGDTVNIAARVEASSEEGRINVSAYTHDKIKDKFSCEYRGKINAKGKGDLDMYFIK